MQPSVRVSGTISCSGMLAIGSNKTILGASGAKIVGCGLNIKNAKNVIVRNLTFDDWDDDAINVETVHERVDRPEHVLAPGTTGRWTPSGPRTT